ncbi:hypothetical protein F4561_004367 [Lipingzhangella halophila]|uniref:DUF2469 family protein n=2 Tax=Lipingzhangella halophila TaxID=1783352 RepID=A0A7W7RKM2_9ACTN|nr:hypothetical protein [Lipingzhangella halophila]
MGTSGQIQRWEDRRGEEGRTTEPGVHDESEHGMSSEDLERYEADMELQLYREYRDVVGLFSYVVETERRFYLTNHVDLQPRTTDNGEMYFEVTMEDAWVWDMYRPARFVRNVRVVTFKDVNVEEITKADLEVPSTGNPGDEG